MPPDRHRHLGPLDQPVTVAMHAKYLPAIAPRRVTLVFLHNARLALEHGLTAFYPECLQSDIFSVLETTRAITTRTGKTLTNKQRLSGTVQRFILVSPGNLGLLS